MSDSDSDELQFISSSFQGKPKQRKPPRDRADESMDTTPKPKNRKAMGGRGKKASHVASTPTTQSDLTTFGFSGSRAARDEQAGSPKTNAKARPIPTGKQTVSDRAALPPAPRRRTLPGASELITLDESDDETSEAHACAVVVVADNPTSSRPPEAGPSRHTVKRPSSQIVQDEEYARQLADVRTPSPPPQSKRVKQDSASTSPNGKERVSHHPIFSSGASGRQSEPQRPGQSSLNADTSMKHEDVKRETIGSVSVLGAAIAPGSEISYPLQRDIFDFLPSRDIDTSSWPRQNGKVIVPYAFLTAAFVLIAATRSRLVIVTLLTNALRTITHFQPDALLHAVYLTTNHVAPSYEGIELGIAGTVVTKAIKTVSNAGPGELKKLWTKHGDMGDVAFECKARIRTIVPTAPLTISGVYKSLVKLAGLRGPGMTQTKSDIVQKMLVSARGEEVRFLVRTFVSHLRINAVRLTVTASLARAFCLTDSRHSEEEEFAALAATARHKRAASFESSSSLFWIPVDRRQGLRATAKTVKEGKDLPARLALMQTLAAAERTVKTVYVRHPNYNHIVPALLETGLSGLAEAVPIAIGTPLNPMLGQITRDLGDVAQRLAPNRPFVAEWKYDGQRVQIHARTREPGEKVNADPITVKGKGGKWVGDDNSVYVRLFSRHLEDMTEKYPDILALVPTMLNATAARKSAGEPEHVDSFVMDAEVVAIDVASGALQTFQALAGRAKKDVQLGEVKVRVGVFAFDLMQLNGVSLLEQPFRRRRDLIKKLLPPRTPDDLKLARFDHVKSLEGSTADLEPIAEFMAEAISNRCEGLMIKVLDNEPVDSLAIQTEPAHSDDDGISDSDEESKAHLSPQKPGRKKALLSTYEPDKRADSWLKVKRDYGALGDSLDLVPIGAWHGQGRKVGWWSPILLALYNPETEGFQAVCKCISGFTDEFYKSLNERYKRDSDNCSRTRLATIEPGGLHPDYWWEPSEVWEIRGADLTLSPTYNAAQGLISAERGLSLRFPRFIKVRDDKSIEHAMTPQDLAAAYERQTAGQLNGHSSQNPVK
ncbi:uncharacterized protein L969DRAFT_54793 [Mixia osmundae IAM 14324]|uniref:ATP-dependent DNA ligase family profile domain-containing protein n=1 Tax=Mixia osmundae (strain CBS 9802 / IAM 14324 / JCM 22182 / KY 12970) TaxID=764103 RepID=G7EB46_MIXOS|nr:uncharacterized protein L969DRAFT_54793 [Mixia osmundae IAM 14324]KEI36575.1 hypothetical protein L969DRAFT_54793 [Mixia osmundae IAM 14324]GAB00057.1 hypothetical protein E5Q_06759 [Mixia osmundae IAM 14324]